MGDLRARVLTMTGAQNQDVVAAMEPASVQPATGAVAKVTQQRAAKQITTNVARLGTGPITVWETGQRMRHQHQLSPPPKYKCSAFKDKHLC